MPGVVSRLRLVDLKLDGFRWKMSWGSRMGIWDCDGWVVEKEGLQ